MSSTGLIVAMLWLCSLGILQAKAAEIGDIRLLDGPSIMEGRIEIYVDIKPGGPQWARLCDEGWTDITADIACRQLGFEEALHTSFYGDGTLRDVVRVERCSPDQSRLLPGCHVKNGGRSCRRNRDAGVACALFSDPPTAQGMRSRKTTTTPMATPTSTPPSTTTMVTTRAATTSPVPTTAQLMTSPPTDALTTGEFFSDETPEASTSTADPITTMFVADVGRRAIRVWTMSVVIVLLCLIVSITLVVIFLRNRCRSRNRKAGDVEVNVEAPPQLSSCEDEEGEYQYAAPLASVALSGQGSTVSLAGSEVQVDEGFYTLPANAAAAETNPYQELNVKSNTFAGLKKLKKRPPQQTKDVKDSEARRIIVKNPPQTKKKPVIDVVRKTNNLGAARRDAENEYDLPIDTSKSQLTMVNNATYGDYGADPSTAAAQSDYVNDIDLKTLKADSTYATPESVDATGVDNSDNYYLVPDQESPYVNTPVGTYNRDEEEGNEYCAISRKPTVAI